MSEYSFPFRNEEERRLIEDIDGLEITTSRVIRRAIEQLTKEVSNDPRFNNFTPDKLAEVICREIESMTKPEEGLEKAIASTINCQRIRRAKIE